MILWLRSLFHTPTHFHLMLGPGPSVCGRRGGTVVFTKDELPKIDCMHCKIWLEQNPHHPRYATLHDWLYETA